MKSGIRKVLAIGSLAIAIGAQSAMAGSVSVELLGNGTYSMPVGTPTATRTFGYPGGGLNLNIHLGTKVAFQLGGHYATRVVTTDAAYTSKYVSGNAGFKLMLSRGFAFIVGGYYNRYFTDPFSLTGTDYGLSGGIGLTVPMGSSVGLYISPMYHYSLSTLAYGAASTLTPHEIVGFAGLIFGGGSK